MGDLIPKNTDDEMERYNEADMIRRARIPMENNAALVYEVDPVSKREVALFPLSSGGYVKIGERAVTPAQAAETDVLAAQATVQNDGRTPIGMVLGGIATGPNAEGVRIDPTMEDYASAGYTEAEVIEYQNQKAVSPTTQFAVQLAPEQVQTGVDVGAPMLTTRDATKREGATEFLAGAGDGAASQFLKDVYEAIGLDEFEARRLAEAVMGNPNSTRDFGFGLADLTPAGIIFGAEEGYNTFQRGLSTDDPLTAGLGALEAGLSVLEAAPMVGAGVRGLRELATPAMREAINTLRADAIGAGRAVMQGDTEMLGEVFQPSGTARSLGAAGVDDQTPTVLGSTVSLRSDGPQAEQARQSVIDIAKQRNPEAPRPRVKIEDIASFHEQNHLAQYGRRLDPSNSQDFDLAVDAAANELRYQLDQAVSGKGWYDSDVKKTFEIASRIPGLESLATNETDRVIMSAIMAPTSIGQLVTNNTRAAIAAMLQYKRTGQIPTTPPSKGAVTEGIQNAGWGSKQGTVAANMRVISHLVDTLGPDGFADWWLSPHTLKELTEVRKAAGLSAGPSGLSGGQNSVHLGAMVIGDKTGKFSLNINGYEGTTKDVWFTRSYNRLFGNMRDNAGEVAGGPRSLTERRQMEEFVLKMRDRLQDQGLSEQDIQAVMWYYEQNLMTDLGVQSRPGAFSEEAERIYGQLRPGVRGSDATEAAAEPGSLTGFRGVSPTQRTVRAERRLPQRVDPRDPTGQAGPYTRGAGSGDAGDGLLVLEPNAQSQARYQESGLSLPTVREVPAAQSAAQYNADMTSAMAGHRFGAQVEIKSPEELADARLFRTDDGSGFAIKPDGDIVAVFAGQNAARGSGYSMLQAAVAAGGRKLDAFDTYLPKIYETAGFRPVARLPWNDEFAPPNWEKETFSNFNNGEPDVVFFVYDPDYYGGAVDVPVFNDYGDAVVEQDKQLQALGGRR
jgi:hypothetical protein